MAPDPSAPAVARSFVRDRLDRWGVAGATATAELLVSELVTNVVRHARSTSTLTLTLAPGRLRVAVTDASPQPAVVRPPIPEELLSGWGLAIVERLAERWGYEARAAGKTVWFELDPTASGA